MAIENLRNVQHWIPLYWIQTFFTSITELSSPSVLRTTTIVKHILNMAN